MFRRSRFSVRPNVGATGKAAAVATRTPKDSTSENTESEKSADPVTETPTTVTDSTCVVAPTESSLPSGDGNDPTGEVTSSSAAVQRRKRVSVRPKVAPGRISATTRTIKAAVEQAVAAPEDSCTKLDTEDSRITTVPQKIHSPELSVAQDGKQSCSEQERSVFTDVEQSAEETQTVENSGEEVLLRPPDKVPLSIPDRETTELSEKAKTLITKPLRLPSLPRRSLSRLLNDPSDLQKIEKTRKLRELLRQEMHKEKTKHRRPKYRVKEFTLDPTKMTMRDLLHYHPTSNPMSSSLEETTLENETVLPNSPPRPESPEKAEEPIAKSVSRSDEDEEEAAVEAEEDDDAVMVPQVKVAEDGSLIIDEESLTVEVLRAKGPNPAQDRDPIFERGSTTTYSSFRKGTHTKPWSTEETDMFYLAINMVGTDFSMICQLFTHRARSEIKNKFKKEERENAWRIDKAFRERRKLDLEYFAKLLVKVMEAQQKKKRKSGSLQEKSASRKKNKKTKEKAYNILSDEDEDEEEEGDAIEIVDDEEEGEKENEDLCNDSRAQVSTQKGKRKRTSLKGSDDEMSEKRNKEEKTSEQDKVLTPEDVEATLPEEQTTSVQSENDEGKTAPKSAVIKPAKLSRGRAPKPLLPLGKRWSKKLPTVTVQTEDGETAAATTEQDKKKGSPERQVDETRTERADSSEDEECSVKLSKATRSGRMPKPVQHLTYAAKEDAQPSGAAPRPRQKRQRESQESLTSKKTKLFTLTFSQSEYSDEEDERQRHEEEEEDEILMKQWKESAPGEESSAPAFVPASLRAARVQGEVETIEELDILASIPNVLDMSHENEMGTTEPEHQLDLLLDVIDLLSTEAPGGTDRSYNEAAQTLLTISNLPNSSQLNETLALDQPPEERLVAVRSTKEEEENLQVGCAEKELSVTASSAEKMTELQNTPSSDAIIDSETPLQKSSHCTREGHLHKEKPKPNLLRTARTTKSQPTKAVEIQENVSTCSANEKSHVVVEDDTPVVQALIEEPDKPNLFDSTVNKNTDQTFFSDLDSELKSSTSELMVSGSPQSQSTPNKRGCLPKVKPKPNLTRVSRTAHAKSSASNAEEIQLHKASDVEECGEAQSCISVEIQCPNPSEITALDQITPSLEQTVSDPTSRTEAPTCHSSTEEVQSQDALPSMDDFSGKTNCLKPSKTHLEPTLELVSSALPDHESTETQMDLQITDESNKAKAEPEVSLKDSPSTRRGRLFMVKPKPNLERASRTVPAKSKLQIQEVPSTSNAGDCNRVKNTVDNPSQLPSGIQKSPTTTEDSEHVTTATFKDIQTPQKDVECVANKDVLGNPEMPDKGSQPITKRFARLNPKPNLRRASKVEPVMSPKSLIVCPETDVLSSSHLEPSIPATVLRESQSSSVPSMEKAGVLTDDGGNGGSKSSGQDGPAEPSQEPPAVIIEPAETPPPVRKSRLKIKPNLAQTSRAVRGKTLSKEEPSTAVQSQNMVVSPSSAQVLTEKLNLDETTADKDCRSTSLDMPECLDTSVLEAQVTTDQVSESMRSSNQDRTADPEGKPQVDNSLDFTSTVVKENQDSSACASLVEPSKRPGGSEVESHGSASHPKPDLFLPPQLGKPCKDPTSTSSPGTPIEAQSHSPEKTNIQRRRVARAKPNLGKSAQAKEVRGKVASSKTGSPCTVASEESKGVQDSVDHIPFLNPTQSIRKKGGNSHEVMATEACAGEEALVSEQSVGCSGDNTQLSVSQPEPLCESKEDPKSTSKLTRKSDDTKSEQLCSKKAKQTRCGPLLKPRSRPAVAAAQAETDSEASSKHEPEVRPNTEEVPADPETSSIPIFQSIYPDVGTMPSDPDEPFFVLSLTPLWPPGEVAASEAVSYLPAADASEQPRSAESLPVEGEVLLLNVPVDLDSTLVSVQSPGQNAGDHVKSRIEKAEPPPAVGGAAVQSEERDVPPVKTQTRRRAKKPEVKPETKRKSRAKNSRQAGSPSQQLQSADNEGEKPEVDLRKEGTSATSTPLRESKASLSLRQRPTESPILDSRAAPTSKPTKTRKAVCVASTSRDLASRSEVVNTSQHQSREKPQVKVSPSAEVLRSDLSSQPSDCAADEATSVSQYFLSDIFTEVEET